MSFSQLEIFEKRDILAQKLLVSSTAAKGWGSIDPAEYWELLALLPWQSGGLEPESDSLKRALQLLVLEPRHFGAHAVLGLFKRRLRWNAEQPEGALRELLSGLIADSGHFLEILPPVSDLKITVVMITYNRLSLLQRAVQAILAQTYSDWQLIILDHGSTDGTTAWCRDLESQYPDKIHILYRETNQGIAALGEHYQALFEAVDTELVLYQSDDDWLLPGHLAATAALYKEFPWIGMASGSYAMVNSAGELILTYGPFYPAPCRVSNQRELQRAFVAGVCPQASVFRKTLLKELGPIDFLFYSEKNAYAIWDYLVTVKHLGLFEVAYTPERIACFYSSEETAYTQTDFSIPLLKLMEILNQDYQGLFGSHSFPLPIMMVFLNGLILRRLMGERLKNCLAQLPSSESLEAEIARLMPAWETYLSLKTKLLEQTDPHAHLLIDLQNPYV